MTGIAHAGVRGAPQGRAKQHQQIAQDRGGVCLGMRIDGVDDIPGKAVKRLVHKCRGTDRGTRRRRGGPGSKPAL